jgi:hypothetical protein
MRLAGACLAAGLAGWLVVRLCVKGRIWVGQLQIGGPLLPALRCDITRIITPYANGSNRLVTWGCSIRGVDPVPVKDQHKPRGGTTADNNPRTTCWSIIAHHTLLALIYLNHKTVWWHLSIE